MKYCRNCGSPVEDDEEVCQNCGHDQFVTEEEMQEGTDGQTKQETWEKPLNG